MNRLVKTISVILAVSIFMILPVGCMKPMLPDVEIVSRYNEVELRNLADSVDEKELTEGWGEPLTVNDLRLWPVDLTGGTIYVVACVKNGDVISVNISKTMFINVVKEQDGVKYCLYGRDRYSTDASDLAFMPTQDIWGNDINCEVGDRIIFECDDMVMETYPAQLSAPYSVRVMGHLSDEEIDDIASGIVLP